MFFDERKIHDRRQDHKPYSYDTRHHDTIHHLSHDKRMWIYHLGKYGEKKQSCFWVHRVREKTFSKGRKIRLILTCLDMSRLFFFCAKELIRKVEQIEGTECLDERKQDDRLRDDESDSGDAVCHMDEYSESYAEGSHIAQTCRLESIFHDDDHIGTWRDSSKKSDRSKYKQFRHSKKCEDIKITDELKTSRMRDT